MSTRKDSNLILNEWAQGATFSVRQDSNALLNAIYDGSLTLSVNVTGLSTDNIEDFNIGTASNGDVLVYNSTSGKWENSEYNIQSFANLSDVSITGLTGGDRLVYNGTTEKWENTVIPAGTSGSSGSSGVDGSSGSSGSSGVDGSSGSSGVDGSSGSSGVDGSSGSSGVDGSSGSSGVDGISGSSGVDGSSGTSGLSYAFDAEAASTTPITAAINKTYLLDTTSASITVNLPAAASSTDKEICVVKVDSTVNTVTIDGNASETINGALTYVLGAQYDFVRLICDGSNWFIIG